MRIYPVISVTQLEPTSDRSEDLYSRVIQPPLPVKEEIDNILDLTIK